MDVQLGCHAWAILHRTAWLLCNLCCVSRASVSQAVNEFQKYQLPPNVQEIVQAVNRPDLKIGAKCGQMASKYTQLCIL
jgi:hypothetical protein